MLHLCTIFHKIGKQQGQWEEDGEKDGVGRERTRKLVKWGNWLDGGKLLVQPILGSPVWMNLNELVFFYELPDLFSLLFRTLVLLRPATAILMLYYTGYSLELCNSQIQLAYLVIRLRILVCHVKELYGAYITEIYSTLFLLH